MLRSISWITEKLTPATEAEQFFKAVKKGRIKFITEYISKYPTTYALYEGLIIALQYNQNEAAKILLDHGITVNDAMSQALYMGLSIDIIQMLIGAGADCNALNIRSVYPLTIAIYKNKLDIVNLLLNAGANPNLPTDCSYGIGNALAVACDQEDNIEIIKRLIAAGTDLANTDPRLSTSPLIEAAARGRGDIVALLLQSGVDCEYKGYKDRTALSMTIKFNHVSCFELLLNAGTKYNTEETDSYPYILTTAILGQIEMMRILLSRGVKIPRNKNGDVRDLHDISNPIAREILMSTLATEKAKEARFIKAIKRNKPAIMLDLIHDNIDVNCVDSDGLSSIHIACLKGSCESVEVLVRAGANLNSYNPQGDTPLGTMIKNIKKNKKRYIKILKILLNAKCDVNFPDKLNNETPLHLAAAQGNIEFAKLIIAAGANTEAQSTFGSTPLIRAIEKSQIEMVEFLLAHGSNAKTANEYKGTPLACAVRSDNVTIVDKLLSSGSDPHTIDEIYDALSSAMNFNYFDIVKLFLDLDVNHIIENTYGYSSLLILAYKSKKIDCKSLLKYLITNKNTNLNTQNRYNGNTALILAAKYNNTYLAELLVTHGAQVDLPNKMGFTPLNEACKKSPQNSIEIIKILLQSNPDLEIPDSDGNTPIMWAAYSNNSKAIEILLRAGAKIDTVNKKNLSALAIAFEFKSYQAITTLIAAGADYCRIISNDKPQLLSWPVLDGCYEYAMRILNGLVSVTFNSEVNTSISNVNAALEIIPDVTESAIEENILLLRALAALPHVMRYSDPEKIQQIHSTIAMYLAGDNTLTPKAQSHTHAISASKLACIKEYLREIELDQLSQMGLIEFMKKYFNIDNFDIHSDITLDLDETQSTCLSTAPYATLFNPTSSAAPISEASAAAAYDYLAAPDATPNSTSLQKRGLL